MPYPVTYFTISVWQLYNTSQFGRPFDQCEFQKNSKLLTQRLKMAKFIGQLINAKI